MTIILMYLKLAMPFLALAENFARSVDTNTTGVDDDIAARLKETNEFISKIVGAGTGSEPTEARGLAATQAFGEKIIESLNGLKDAEMLPVDKSKEARRLLAMLSDSSLVYQARKGKDAEVLNDFKVQAKELLAGINK